MRRRTKRGWTRVFAAICLAGALRPSGASAQVPEPGDASVWDIRWAQAIRVRDGADVEIQGWGDAVLTLTFDDGRVTGRWTTNVLEEVNWTVAGTLDAGELRLEATEHDSRNPELAVVEKLELQARLDDGSIEGWIALSFRGVRRDPARRPLSGHRRGG